jgi:transcription elongation factor Elf1
MKMKPWEWELVDRFVCPGCGAKNTPKITVIQLGRSGDARCSHCGHEAAAKRFLPAPENGDA